MNTQLIPSEFEQKHYKNWLSKGYFFSKPNPGKKRFSISMPPPNITGQLHLGHALDNSIQDAVVRFKRMQGFETMWLPGTDHAAIATEAKICEALAAEGLSKDIIGRDAFMQRTEEWYAKYGKRIREQLEALGVSCDWNRMSFTLDENLSRAVRKVFVSYYEQGLIYRGKRVVNWCPKCRSAISDTENIHKEQDTSIWHIKYPLSDNTGFVVVATTRPETMFGDTAVAVNPKDARYVHLIGKTLALPLTNRHIPIIADDYCEIGFGSGAVKITPAHDPNDYEIGLRHNLNIVTCISDTGILNENAGEFNGLDRFEGRKQVVKKLQEQGLIVKTEKYKNKVGTCERCATIIEPKISLQWFVKMQELAAPAVQAVKNGELKFYPKRFEKQYLGWLENIQDWCISRQLWLGHRIPVFYCNNCGETIVSETDPCHCPKCHSHKLTQDSDVLDTWFSSALWPFSTLGYPEKTADLDYYYPNNLLVTGYDIITFWVTKMVYSGIHFMGKVPFSQCLIHGLVRDASGRKMSKSLNNGIDPMAVAQQYGADALRISLLSGMALGGDIKYTLEKADKARNFLNKLWNASKFVLAHCTEPSRIKLQSALLSPSEAWIVSDLNNLIKDLTKKIEKNDLGPALQNISDFTWGKFCDWFIELSKADLFGNDNERKETAKAVLEHVLTSILKLLHPFAPFTTEEIFKALPWNNDKSIMVQAYPEFDKKLQFDNANNFEHIISLVKDIRTFRSDMNIAQSKRTNLFLMPTKHNELFSLMIQGINKLAMGKQTTLIASESELVGKHTKIISANALVFIPNNDLFDSSKEKERLNKELQTVGFEIERSNSMLNNQKFMAKAPKDLVEAERAKLALHTLKQSQLLKAIAEL